MLMSQQIPNIESMSVDLHFQTDLVFTIEECREALIVTNGNIQAAKIWLENRSAQLKSSEISGIVAGNLGSAVNYADNVKMGAVRGHGFAAEKANHLYDKLSGKDAQLVGDNNLKNGADRVVNGTQIQTKFCNGGGKCISECFEGNNFRYWNADGSPMQIEVPKDFHQDAVKSFTERVKRNTEQFGISGSDDEVKKAAEKLAKDTIKESPFTYAQAKNIAKFGTVESLTFDAVNGISVAGTAMGVSAVISFATAMWSGEDFDVALKSACYSGLKVGGIAWVSSIASSQLGKTGFEQSLRPTTDWVVQQLGNKTSAVIANSLRIGGKPIYGIAASNHLSKLMRGNVVTGVVTVGVLSSVDFYRMFQGRVSGAQVFKNVTNTAASVAGGTAGWMGGATAGASVGGAIGSFFPIVGNAVGAAAGGVIGGILGSLGGGAAANKVSSAVMDNLIEDDSKEMQDILSKVFTQLAKDYLLNQTEAETILTKLQEKLSVDVLRDMYAAKSRQGFANDLIEPLIVTVVKQRKVIRLSDLPTLENLADGTEAILEAELAQA